MINFKQLRSLLETLSTVSWGERSSAKNLTAEVSICDSCMWLAGSAAWSPIRIDGSLIRGSRDSARTVADWRQTAKGRGSIYKTNII